MTRKKQIPCQFDPLTDAEIRRLAGEASRLRTPGDASVKLAEIIREAVDVGLPTVRARIESAVKARNGATRPSVGSVEH